MTKYSRAKFLSPLVVIIFSCVIHTEAASARDVASEALSYAFPRVESCEGFFTLGHLSQLVVGSDEFLDSLLTLGAIHEDVDVETFDQDQYARERRHHIRTFDESRVFRADQNLPPGMKITLRPTTPGAPRLELFTASLLEQVPALARIIRDHPDDEPMVLGLSGEQIFLSPRPTVRRPRELLVVRTSETALPTPADFAHLTRVRKSFPGVPVTGVLRVMIKPRDTLIIYR